MKTKAISILLAAATLAGIIACTGNDNATVTLPDDPAAVTDPAAPVPARITAAMAGAAVATPGTRAVNDRWNHDHIGVVAAAPDNHDMRDRYLNAHYVTNSTGTTAEFAPASADHTIYFSGPDEKVFFYAYAPYQPSAAPSELPGADDDNRVFFDTRQQTTPEAQQAIDFLFTGVVSASKSSPTVSFTGDNSFRHMMTRLVLIIQTPAATGFSPDDVERITAVKIGGLCTAGYIRMYEDGIIFVTREDSRLEEWDITQNVNRVETEGGVKQRVYTLIFPSQELQDKNGTPMGAIPLSITLGKQEYKNTTGLKGEPDLPGNFGPGKSYEYTILLKKTALEVTGATIADWVVGGSDTGDAIPTE